MNILKEFIAESLNRPIETRLQSLIDQARSTGAAVSIDVHFAVFKEFDSRVRKVTVDPDGLIHFFMKDGTSLGSFTLDELVADYPQD